MEETKKMYINHTKVQEVYIESTPAEDLGWTWEEYVEYVEIGDPVYYDTGLVPIDRLMEVLTEMKANGCNYVACDYHFDHRELEVHGSNYRIATEQEIENYTKGQQERQKKADQDAIERLEKQLHALKNK